MSLAIFDLDHTLLEGDSDYLWGRFLAEQGIVDSQRYESENARFLRAYESGELDIHEFLRFALAPLARHSPAELETWRSQFVDEKIRPIALPAASALVDRHRSRGDTLLIITATNRFVTTPIAALFGIEHLLATEPELVDGRYTGRAVGTPTFREGKVEALDGWLRATGHTLAGSVFYSDSHNDLPLLERVDQPVAVDPDPSLGDTARARGWNVITLRQGDQPRPG